MSSLDRSKYLEGNVLIEEKTEDAVSEFDVQRMQTEHNIQVITTSFQRQEEEIVHASSILTKSPENEDSDLKIGCNAQQIDEEQHKPVSMIYKLTDNPPFQFLILFALQQSFLVISTPLSTTVIVAQAVCAQNDDELKIRLLSSTFFMMGLSTFAMTTFGVRLPIFQGPNPGYIIPLLILQTLDEFKCPETFNGIDPMDNSTKLMAYLDNSTIIPNRDVSLQRINAYAGALISVGVIHFLIGATGAVSLIARLVGPITIVPVVLLFGIYIHTIVVSFTETHWPTAMLTCSTVIILALYLEHHNTPIPVWTPSRGFRVVWQPLHRIFALLLSIMLGWGTCAILTATGALSDDKNSKEYLARTDARMNVVNQADWLMFPYPGQFGVPEFSLAAFVPFLISCILSVLDSIGDYNASARVTSTPPPPSYALNRGITVEGFMSILSGAFGCSHATVSFGENIGAMGISRVASRSVFQVTGLIYILFAFFGKFGAFFITIPHSVIGGTQIITFGILIGVVLSYLENIDLRSQRNLSILGIAIFMGMAMPYWISKNPNAINTSVEKVDNIFRMFLSNPSFVGGFIACFFDNTIPGTAKERGIAAQTEEIRAGSQSRSKFIFENSVKIYRLSWIPGSFRRSKMARFVRLFDNDDLK